MPAAPGCHDFTRQLHPGSTAPLRKAALERIPTVRCPAVGEAAFPAADSRTDSPRQCGQDESWSRPPGQKPPGPCAKHDIQTAAAFPSACSASDDARLRRFRSPGPSPSLPCPHTPRHGRPRYARHPTSHPPRATHPSPDSGIPPPGSTPAILHPNRGCPVSIGRMRPRHREHHRRALPGSAADFTPPADVLQALPHSLQESVLHAASRNQFRGRCGWWTTVTRRFLRVWWVSC
jgi:hypothetical protein